MNEKGQKYGPIEHVCNDPITKVNDERDSVISQDIEKVIDTIFGTTSPHHQQQRLDNNKLKIKQNKYLTVTKKLLRHLDFQNKKKLT